MSKTKKSSSTQNATSSNTLDPTLSGLLYGNVGTAQDKAATLQPFSGQRVAGFNDTQTAAQQGLLDLANQHVGSDLLNTAASTATAATGYKPLTVTASPITATTATAAPDVTTGPISAADIANYFNPYEDSVVATTNADLDRQRQIEQVNNAAQATKAHAFGGTGAAVLSGLTNDNYARQVASTDANLRNTGYTTALTAAQADAARKLAADQGNQSAANGINIFNAGALNTTAGQNAANELAAQTANQDAGLTANGQSLTAADLLGHLADQQRTDAIGDAGLIGQVGDAQQAQAQKELDAALQAWQDGVNLTAQQQQLINSALALLPVTGTTTSSGSSTSKETSPLDIGKILGGVGSLASGLGSLGWAPFAA